MIHDLKKHMINTNRMSGLRLLHYFSKIELRKKMDFSFLKIIKLNVCLKFEVYGCKLVSTDMAVNEKLVKKMVLRRQMPKFIIVRLMVSYTCSDYQISYLLSLLCSTTCHVQAK